MFSRIMLALRPVLRAFCVTVFCAQVATALVAAAHLVWTPANDMVVVPTEWAVGQWAQPVLAFVQKHPSLVLAGMLAALGVALTLIYRRLFLGRPQGWPTWIASQIFAFSLAGPMLAAQVGWLVGLTNKTPIGATRLFRYWVRKGEVDELGLTAVYTNWLKVWGPTKGLNPDEVAYLAGHAPDAARRLLTPDSLAEFTREQLNALAESLSASAVNEYLVLKAASTAEAVAEAAAKAADAEGYAPWWVPLGLLAGILVLYGYTLHSIAEAAFDRVTDEALPKITKAVTEAATQDATETVKKTVAAGVLKAVLPAVTFAAESTARSTVADSVATATAAADLAKSSATAAAESAAAAASLSGGASSLATEPRGLLSRVAMRGVLSERIDSLSDEVKHSLSVGLAAGVSVATVANTVADLSQDVDAATYAATTAVDASGAATDIANAANTTALAAYADAAAATTAANAANTTALAASAAAAAATTAAAATATELAEVKTATVTATDVLRKAMTLADNADAEAANAWGLARDANDAAIGAVSAAEASIDACNSAQRIANAATASNAALALRVEALERAAATNASVLASAPAPAASEVAVALALLDSKVSILNRRADLTTKRLVESADVQEMILREIKDAEFKALAVKKGMLFNTVAADRNTAAIHNLFNVTADEMGERANTAAREPLGRALRAQLAIQAPPREVTIENPWMREHMAPERDVRIANLTAVLGETKTSGAKPGSSLAPAVKGSTPGVKGSSLAPAVKGSTPGVKGSTPGVKGSSLAPAVKGSTPGVKGSSLALAVKGSGRSSTVVSAEILRNFDKYFTSDSLLDAPPPSLKNITGKDSSDATPPSNKPPEPPHNSGKDSV